MTSPGGGGGRYMAYSPSPSAPHSPHLSSLRSAAAAAAAAASSAALLDQDKYALFFSLSFNSNLTPFDLIFYARIFLSILLHIPSLFFFFAVYCTDLGFDLPLLLIIVLLIFKPVFLAHFCCSFQDLELDLLLLC